MDIFKHFFLKIPLRKQNYFETKEEVTLTFEGIGIHQIELIQNTFMKYLGIRIREKANLCFSLEI